MKTNILKSKTTQNVLAGDAALVAIVIALLRGLDLDVSPEIVAATIGLLAPLAGRGVAWLREKIGL